MKYQRLEDLRTDRDLTIRQVADYLGCNRDVYTRYEKASGSCRSPLPSVWRSCIRSVWIIWSASAMRSGRIDPDFPVSPPQQKQEDSFSFPVLPVLLFVYRFCRYSIIRVSLSFHPSGSPQRYSVNARTGHSGFPGGCLAIRVLQLRSSSAFLHIY